MIRRRPLLRTAVVGGVAYTAGSHVAQKSAEQAQLEAQQNAQIADLQQQQQAAAQSVTPPPQPAEPVQPMQQPPAQSVMPPPQPAPDRLTQLKQLGELREAGVLTDAEFESEKQKILQGT